MTQFSEENFKEENSELYFCSYYVHWWLRFLTLQTGIIQAIGIDDDCVDLHRLPFWKVILLESFDLKGLIITINICELLYFRVKELPLSSVHLRV